MSPIRSLVEKSRITGFAESFDSEEDGCFSMVFFIVACKNKDVKLSWENKCRI